MIRPDILLCGIIATELGLDASRVVVYNQNWKSPKDDNIYIVVSERMSRIIGSTNRFDIATNREDKRVSVSTTYNIEITSRNTDAKYRKNEVIAALTSNYSERIQEENEMRIFRTNQITDLSFIDGRSALHRYQIPVIINSVHKYEREVDFYDKYQNIETLEEAF